MVAAITKAEFKIDDKVEKELQGTSIKSLIFQKPFPFDISLHPESEAYKNC